MKQILKRLELIKIAISLEDSALINLQVQELYNLNCDTKIKNIINLVSKNDYENVITLIEDYIRKYSGITTYENPEIQGLTLELRVFEDKLQKLSDEKSEYLHIINSFNHNYNLELGGLLREILKLKHDISVKNLEEADSGNYERRNEEYENIKKRYSQFNQEYEIQLKDEQNKLTTNEKKELKALYREASKLCHPDLVIDNKKQKAEEVFKILNEAYSQNDLEEVRDILNNLKLEKEFNHTSEATNDKEILKDTIIVLKIKINALKDEIKDILDDENYIRIISIDNMEIYFEDLKLQLQNELDDLKKKEAENDSLYS